VCLQDAEAKRVHELRAQYRINAIRKLRKANYKGKLTKEKKYINLNEILLKAVEHGNFEEAGKLIKAGGDPEYSNSDGHSLIHIAVKNNDIGCTKTLIDWRCSLNRKQKTEMPLIVLACYCCSEEVIRILLDGGADPDERDPRNGQTPLIVSLTLLKKEIFFLLIRHGANPRLSDNVGRTPLMFSAKLGYVECIQAMLKYPKLILEVNKKDKVDGCTALMYAAKHGQHESCIELLKNGASKTAKDSNGQCALLWAEMFGARKQLIILLHPKVPP